MINFPESKIWGLSRAPFQITLRTVKIYKKTDLETEEVISCRGKPSIIVREGMNFICINIFRGTKRRREVEDNISVNEEIERLLSTPKKKKLQTTSQYIYDNLFSVRACLCLLYLYSLTNHFAPIRLVKTATLW